MRKIDETKTRFYFAADSDIIISLDKISKGVPDKISENPFLKNIYLKLWNMVYSGDVKLYITPQVLLELGEKITQYTNSMASRNDVAVFIGPAKFIRSFCYPIYFSRHEESSFQERAKHLADRYCIEAGMDGIISQDADGNTYVIPSKDAKVLAEASLCGLTLLTCNTMDMILTKNNGEYSPDKLSKIEEINIQEGLSYGDKCLWKKAPTPISLAEFINFLPDCYMDEPFLPDTNNKVHDLEPSEVMWQNREQYEMFFKFMYFIEHTKKDKVEAVGIQKPYDFIINGKRYKSEILNNEDGKQNE